MFLSFRYDDVSIYHKTKLAVKKVELHKIEESIARGIASQKCLGQLRKAESDAALKVTASVRCFIFHRKMRCAKRSEYCMICFIISQMS